MKTKTQQVLAGVVGLAYSLLTAALALLCTEWVQRGTLEGLTPTAANPFYRLADCTVHLRAQ